MLERVLQYSQAYNFYQWVKKRHGPEPGTVFLSQRRVYILPTRSGLAFGAVLVLMLIGSINYNLALGYLLTFLLGGLGVVSILHTFRNLAHLYISAGRVEPAFAGETAVFEVVIENRSGFDRFSLDFRAGSATVRSHAPAGRLTAVGVPVQAARRGWLRLPRVTIETRFPLGLTRAWSYVQPDMRTLVYPRPDRAPLPPPPAAGDAGQSAQPGAGSEDFAGLRPYQRSDSPRHIAWKASARSEALLTKTFAGQAASELWLDWNSLPAAMDVEARLSRLCGWVMICDARRLRYGLRLPAARVPLGEGREHRDRCLRELALYAL